MRMECIAVTVLIGLAPFWSSAQTNQLWFKPFPNVPEGAHTFLEWRDLIEQRSAQTQEGGKGLRFVGPDPWLFSDTQAPVAITGVSNGVSFARVREVVASASQIKFRIIDDTAIIGEGQFRYLLLSYSGRCRDAKTDQILTNFTIQADDSPLPSMNLVFDSEGKFTCGVPHIFHYLTSRATSAVFTDDGFPDARQAIRVSAPGYHDCVISNDIWDWRSMWSGSVLDVKLEPK